MKNRSYKALSALMALPRAVVRAVSWLCREVHRWISLLMMAVATMIDGAMHLLNIPHVEGWWIPFFGGGAVVSGVGAWTWLRQWRKKPQA